MTTFTLDEKEKAFKELDQSRDKLLKEIEELTIERNQLISMIKTEKMKMIDKLNELNELYLIIKLLFQVMKIYKDKSLQ